MPSYTPIYRGPNGQFYHDRNYTQPFTQAEMQAFYGANPDFGTIPGNQPVGYRPPTQQNWPSGGGMPNYAPYGWDPTGGQYGVPGNNPFGPLSQGSNPGDGMQFGGNQQGSGMSDFWKQMLVNTGLNLAGGF